MITFSTPPTEANLISGIVNVLNLIPDNTSKEISPKDVRDAVYTLWENTMYKPTSVSGSNIKYIGIDQYQIIDTDGTSIYPTVYFGKKQAGGIQVMKQILDVNGANTDFFFYNMKDNSISNDYDTRIAILAGTSSFIFNGELAAPTLKSYVVTDGIGTYTDFEIKNNSFYEDAGGTQSGGDINILSTAGIISLNNFIFPKSSEFLGIKGEQKDGYVLKYRWIDNKAYGVWESAFSQSITSINSTSQVTITGNPIVLNGYNFTEATVTATAIGGIAAGETFSNVPIQDLLRRIIYAYVPPRIETFFSFNYSTEPITLIEHQPTVPELRLNYTLTVNSTYSVSQFSVTTPYSTPEESLPSTPIVRGTYQGKVWPTEQLTFPSTQAYKILSYTTSVVDGFTTTPRTDNKKLYSVLPYYFGTAATFSNTNTGPNTINNLLGISTSENSGKLSFKLIDPIIGSPTYSNNQSVFVTTTGLPNNRGFIYFGYPIQFPQLKEIRDNQGALGNNVISAFSTYSISINSPTGKWGNREYLFYITSSTTSVPTSTTPYKFIFATQS